MIGEVRWIAYDGLPPGWLDCDGTLYDITLKPDLFAVIGYTWGASVTFDQFAVPDLRRRSLVGDGGTGTPTLGNAIGDVGGQEEVTLTSAQSGVPAHTHPPGAGGSHYAIFNAGLVALATGVPTNLGLATATGANTAADASAPHNTYHPVAVMRPIIYAGA